MAEDQAVAAGELRRSSCELPLNWLTISHSVTSISPISMAKPSSSGTNSTGHMAERISPTKGCVLP
jgi:hypothetical protein